MRLGDTPKNDVERLRAARKAFGEDLVILTDANIGYQLEDVRRVMPVLDEIRAGWLEEPFPAHDHRSYREAKLLGRTPLAAGENHYTRFEFNRVIEDGAITILQPDLSKCGGITEALRIAALGSSWKLPIHPHSSMTGLNHAATIHFLAAIGNGGYFEGDVSKSNLFRDELVENPGVIDRDGNVRPLEQARHRAGSERGVPGQAPRHRRTRLCMRRLLAALLVRAAHGELRRAIRPNRSAGSCPTPAAASPTW